MARVWEIPIELQGFEGRGLKYRGSIWRGGVVLLDGQRVKGRWGRYTLRDNQGREVSLRVRGNGVDPIPKIEVASKVIQLAPPLRWYEYVWAGLPLLLIHVGGALGAAIGAVALVWNAGVFRSDRTLAGKYLTTGAITLGAALAYVVSVSALYLLLDFLGVHPGTRSN